MSLRCSPLSRRDIDTLQVWRGFSARALGKQLVQADRRFPSGLLISRARSDLVPVPPTHHNEQGLAGEFSPHQCYPRAAQAYGRRASDFGLEDLTHRSFFAVAMATWCIVKTSGSLRSGHI